VTHGIFAELGRFFSYYNVVFLLLAAVDTLILAAAGCMVGFLLGFAIAVVRQTSGATWLALRIAAGCYVQLFRRVPFLVTLFLVFYALQASQYDLPVLFIAIITICLIGGAYLSEVVRAGFASVPMVEWQAAAVMNLSLLQTLRYVVIPQSWRVIIPPTVTFFLSFVKDSALASQIGVVELTYAGRVLNNKGFSPVLSFGSILIMYFAMSYPIACAGRYMEKSLGSSGSSGRRRRVR
jgi:polar amino acid transport system permease protein